MALGVTICHLFRKLNASSLLLVNKPETDEPQYAPLS